MTLSVCLIVKNEIDNLERCVRSFIGIAQEVVIVDTGSADGTIELIRKLKAEFPIIKEHHFLWTGRFDEARNFMLSKCTMETILVMDADEELTNFEEFNAEYDVALINTLSKDSEAFIMHHEYRYFKNGLGIKYSNPLHENISASVRDLKLKTYYSNVNVSHYGYENLTEEDKRNKIKSVLEQLKNYTPQDFSDNSYNFLMSNHYNAIGDTDNFIRYANRCLCDDINPQGKALKCNQLALYYYDKDIQLSLAYLADSIFAFEKNQVFANYILCNYFIDIKNKKLAQESFNEIKKLNNKSSLINDMVLSDEQFLNLQKEINYGRI